MQLIRKVLSPPVRNRALLFLACLLFYGAGTWNVPLIDRDEPRFAEASREMRERGDFVVPYFNNEYRFDKPPLIYWLQVGSYHLFGENDFAARFPTLVATALITVLLSAWGSRMKDERAGWGAAIIFVLSFQTFVYGKAAVPDMWLVFFVTAAHWAGFELLRDHLGRETSEPTRREAKYLRLVFFVALGLGFLAKGPIGWIPLLTIASTKLFLRDQSLNRRFRFAGGMLILLAIILPWAVPAILRTHGEFFYVGIGFHALKRMVTSVSINEQASLIDYVSTLPFYVLVIFAAFFPGSLKLPALVWRLRRNRDGVDNYLLAGIIPLFLILTLVYTKYFHYTLSILPLLALLLARHLFELPLARFVPRAAIVVFAVYLFSTVFLSPLFAQLTPSAELFKKSCRDLKPEMEFAAVRYVQPSVTWYFRSRVHRWFHAISAAEVRSFMDSPGARFVILPTRTAQELYPAIPENWKVFRAPWLLRKGNRLDLTLLLKP